MNAAESGKDFVHALKGVKIRIKKKNKNKTKHSYKDSYKGKQIHTDLLPG